MSTVKYMFIRCIKDTQKKNLIVCLTYLCTIILKGILMSYKNVTHITHKPLACEIVKEVIPQVDCMFSCLAGCCAHDNHVVCIHPH